MDTILAVAQRKEFGRLRGVIVAGCLVERYLADNSRKDIPEVDRWLPFKDYPKIVDAARETRRAAARARDTAPRKRVLLTPAGYAYLKISEGCDQKCAFCAIPSFRGRLASRTIEDLVADARTIAARGVGEVDLVSQDTTAYGRDLYGTPRLADLLRALTEVEGPRWWRLLYLYPSILTDDVHRRGRAQPARREVPRHAGPAPRRPACSRPCAAASRPTASARCSSASASASPAPRSAPR